MAEEWKKAVEMKDRRKGFVVDTSRSPYARLRPVPVEAVRLEDSFWAPRLETLRKATLPSQHQQCEDTGRIFNFRRAAGKATGEFQGFFFNDSDVYKWIEAVSFSLAYAPDEGLRALAGGVIAEVAAAQDQDGYLDTFFTFDRRAERWTNLRDMHELYCAGHLVQSAVAYHRATGAESFLNVARRVVDHIAGVFGPDKRPGTPGHPEVEMALVELYRTTGHQPYLDLARFFLDQRGRGVIGGGIVHIDHTPFRELTEIVGHAVRSLYLNCGATDIYMETGEQALWEALERLWRSTTERRMYVTAGVGARREGEAFGVDYELPNAQAYAETCAAIANAMWNWRMLLATGEGKYADVMELALYNGALSGISLDGKEYFYVNPLANRGDHRRQPWFPCACCPPNIARLLASLPGYLYSLSSDGVWVHLYARTTAHLNMAGRPVTIVQRTDYPWDGQVELTVEPEAETAFTLHLRIPGWCREAHLRVNGQTAAEAAVKPGAYVELRRSWRPGDKVHLSLSMPVERVACNPLVAENADRVALKRGPIVYCLEQVDNPEADVWNIVLPASEPLKAEWRPDLLSGVTVIRGEAFAVTADFKEQLYCPMVEVPVKMRRVAFTAVPYYAWANRDPGPMIVWDRSSGQIQWRVNVEGSG